MQPAPDRTEGIGPFPRMIIRGATVIPGTGSPPIGPIDIVIEGNRIVRLKLVGSPGLEIDPERRPEAAEGDYELDASGMYALPGFVDLHGHMGGVAQGTTAEYVFKLWLGHGITTIRDPGSGNGLGAAYGRILTGVRPVLSETVGAGSAGLMRYRPQ